MPKVFVEMTMSLDGYIAAPDVTKEHPLGKGGERLFDWFEGGVSGQPSATDDRLQAEKLTDTGGDRDGPPHVRCRRGAMGS